MVIHFAVALMILQGGEAPADDRAQWLPPVKTVSLERGTRTVREVLDVIKNQTDLDVTVTEAEAAERVEIEFKDRPVLQALGDLCRHLGRGTVNVSNGSKEGQDSVELDLDADPPHAVAYWKQFRAELVNVKIVTRRSLAETKQTASLVFRLGAQPGMRPMHIGSFILDEAVDDAGWSLAVGGSFGPRGESAVAGEDPDFVQFRDGPWSRGVSWRQMQAEIRPPAKRAKTLKRVRARVSLSFPMREVDERVPVEDLVEGKEINIGAMLIRVKSFTQKSKEAVFNYDIPRTGSREGFFGFPDFDLLDDEGNTISQGRSGSGGGDGYVMEYRLSSEKPVVAIRYSAYVGKVTVVVPFEFRNIRLPSKKQ